MTNFHLSAIYCDDIRQEINGKVTLVGCYHSQLLVGAFPCHLPQLAIHFLLEGCQIPLGELVIRVYQGDTEVFRVNGESTPTQTVSQKENERLIGGFAFGPVTLDEPTEIKVEITLPSGETIAALPLEILKRS